MGGIHGALLLQVYPFLFNFDMRAAYDIGNRVEPVLTRPHLVV